jgi:predicted DNA-binding transcriptional regulator AlpA
VDQDVIRLSAVAAYPNVNERVRQLHHAGSLPPPIASEGRSAVWDRDEIEAWAERKWWGTRPWRRCRD